MKKILIIILIILPLVSQLKIKILKDINIRSKPDLSVAPFCYVKASDVYNVIDTLPKWIMIRAISGTDRVEGMTIQSCT